MSSQLGKVTEAVKIFQKLEIFPTHGPARGEDDEVSDGCTGFSRGAGEHCEDGGVAVVITHTVDHTELGQ